jgi:site-specific DNA-methyltransferase (adenine-specific)
VIYARSAHGRALHPTEKPAGIVAPLLRYSCPPGGLIVDPFSGAGAVLLCARDLGFRAIGVEFDETYAERAADRLRQELPFYKEQQQ